MLRRSLLICLLFGLFSIIALVGCCDSERSTAVPAEPAIIQTFCSDGIPLPEYRMGGGVAFEFHYPEEGTLYVVEMRKRKIIASLAGGKGGELRLDDEAIKPWLEGALPGVSLGYADIALFFIPQRLAAYSQMRVPSELPIEEAGAGMGAVSGIAGNVE